MKQTPYNTGKVLIGSMYTPPQRPSNSADDMRLQTALLAKSVTLRSLFAQIPTSTKEKTNG